MGDHSSRKLVNGAFILTFAGFISKLLSAGYRIPLQNLTGDLGFYIYQQIYPFLGIALMLALYGFPSAVSKVVGDAGPEAKKHSFFSFYVPVFLILFAISAVIALLLYLGAGAIADWMGNARLVKGIQLSAFVFLFIPFSALLRGVFQGSLAMKPTALSQVGEQLIRVGIIIAAATFLAISQGDVYEVGILAPIASIAGGFTACMILIVFFIKQKPIDRGIYTVPWKYYLRTILFLGLIASLNHMVLLLTQFADAFTLVPGLLDYGMDQLEAMEMKGVFDRGQPLIQLGTVIGSSFALALIPSVSRKRLETDPESFHFYIRCAMKCSLYLAIGATIGLVMIFPEVNELLFQNGKGTFSLRILALSVFLCSLAMTAASILQGLGFMKRTAIFIMLAFAMKWIANRLFVPVWGITGSAMATVLGLLFLAGLTFAALKRKLPKLLLWKTLNWKALAIAVMGMAVDVWVIHAVMQMIGIQTRSGLLLHVGIVSVTGAFIYVLLLLKYRAFTKEEKAILPIPPWIK